MYPAGFDTTGTTGSSREGFGTPQQAVRAIRTMVIRIESFFILVYGFVQESRKSRASRQSRGPQTTKYYGVGTVKLRLSVLLELLGSSLETARSTVKPTMPGAVGLTTMLTLAFWFAVIAGRVQEIVPAASVQLPAKPFTDRKSVV